MNRKKILDKLPVLKNLQVLPGHYYSPIISIDKLSQERDRIWAKPNKEIIGVDLHEEEQLMLLTEFKSYYDEMPFKPLKTEGLRYYFENNMYSYMDATLLFCMIRNINPKRIIEIGSGFSSALMLDTNDLFFNNGIELTFVEPYPERLNSTLRKGEKINLHQTEVQKVDIEIFKKLEKNDILFIDSSHVSKTGSDVNYLLFEVLPILQKGVVVHIHDILYPFEYPENWIFKEKRSWNEAYILRAFLYNNSKFKIKLFSSFLYQFHVEWFKTNMPICNSEGGNIWIQVH